MPANISTGYSNKYNNLNMTLNELIKLWFDGKITDIELDTLSNNIK